eukprot:gene18363-5864_t
MRVLFCLLVLFAAVNANVSSYTIDWYKPADSCSHQATGSDTGANGTCWYPKFTNIQQSFLTYNLDNYGFSYQFFLNQNCEGNWKVKADFQWGECHNPCDNAEVKCWTNFIANPPPTPAPTQGPPTLPPTPPPVNGTVTLAIYNSRGGMCSIPQGKTHFDFGACTTIGGRLGIRVSQQSPTVFGISYYQDAQCSKQFGTQTDHNFDKCFNDDVVPGMPDLMVSHTQ